MTLESEQLTPRQNQVLNWIRRETARRGFVPTVREAARGLGICPGGIMRHLNTLQAAGFLERTAGEARSLRLTERTSPAVFTKNDQVAVWAAGTLSPAAARELAARLTAAASSAEQAATSSAVTDGQQLEPAAIGAPPRRPAACPS